MKSPLAWIILATSAGATDAVAWFELAAKAEALRLRIASPDWGA